MNVAVPPPRARAGEADWFVPRLPRLSGPYIRGHAAIPDDARAFMDRIFAFLGMDATLVRRRWFDSVRHGPQPVISWVPGRSSAEPMQMLRHTVVRYAFDDIVLRPGATLTLESPFDDPLELYVYRLVVMPGARVTVRGGPAKLTIGCLVGAPPGAGMASLIEVTSAEGRSGEAGRRGLDGALGSHEMPQGGPGHGGTQGSHGMPGAKLGDVVLQVHTLAGRLGMRAQAGRGGAGGPGGGGGQGAGGHSISLYGMGRGGDGAEGAAGGDGGPGGDGGMLRLDVRVRQAGAELALDVRGGQGGVGGSGGVGGLGGIGAPDGAPGRTGRQGAEGRAGRPITVEWAQGGPRP